MVQLGWYRTFPGVFLCSSAVFFGIEQTEVMGLEWTQNLMRCCPLTFQLKESSTERG